MIDVPQNVHTLLASDVRTQTTTGDEVEVLGKIGPIRGLMFVLDVTAAATDGTDTLDVQVQTKLNGNWVPVVSFTQVLGNGGAKRYVAKILVNEAQAMFEASAALAAGSIRHLLGRSFRAVGTQVDGGGSADSFTYSVVAIPF